MPKLLARHRRLLAAAVTALALFASASRAQEGSAIALDTVNPASIIAGEIAVQFKPGVSDDTRAQVLSLVGGVAIRSLDSEMTPDLVLVKVPEGSEISAAQSLGVDPNVLLAEPVLRQASALP